MRVYVCLTSRTFLLLCRLDHAGHVPLFAERLCSHKEMHFKNTGEGNERELDTEYFRNQGSYEEEERSKHLIMGVEQTQEDLRIQLAESRTTKALATNRTVRDVQVESPAPSQVETNTLVSQRDNEEHVQETVVEKGESEPGNTLGIVDSNISDAADNNCTIENSCSYSSSSSVYSKSTTTITTINSSVLDMLAKNEQKLSMLLQTQRQLQEKKTTTSKKHKKSSKERKPMKRQTGIRRNVY